MAKATKVATKSRPRKAAETVTGRRPRFVGWQTSDEEEVERRRWRAVTEALVVSALEPEQPVFGTFRVGSEAGSAYEVEIRALRSADNSCGCTDHRVNGLGTCKHVEAVIARLGAPRQARAGSPRIEVYLRSVGPLPQVRVQWPATARGGAARALVAKYFDDAGTLLGDPAASLPALARELAAAPARVRRVVRVSRHLPHWVEDRRREAARESARTRFLAEVAAGRETLDPLALPLYPYQHEGMLFLAFTERALLADEMGLGKTVQAIAACALLRRLRGVERVLVVCPASLKTEWEEQIARFTDLPARVVLGARGQRLRQYEQPAFFYLTNYEQILADGDEIQRRLAPDVIVLDEAQRIKNWQGRTAEAVKRLRSPFAFVLTGTPLENRIDEIYSIVQFLDPSLFGPLFRFNRDFYDLDENGRPVGYKNLTELNRRLAPVLLRRRKDEVEGELPGRLEKHYFVPMEDEQVARYVDYEARVAKLAAVAKRRALTPEEMEKLQRWLACMRMICDTPYILDPECRVCPKLGELAEILGEVLADPQAKVLIFSEWERMLELVRELAQELEVGFAWHTGSVPQARRREEINRFKGDPACRLFLSTDSGGVGLNLQAANVVINLDLPWNPGRLEQRIARAWRKHQTRPVRVVHLVSSGSIEQRMIPLLAGKKALADGVLDGLGENDSMPLPSGRRALVERLEALTGSIPGSAVVLPEEEGALVAVPEAPVGGLLDRFGDRLLQLEVGTDLAGRETYLAVVDDAAAVDRTALLEALADREGAEGSPPPRLEVLDRATLAAVERLVECGFLHAVEGRRLLFRSPVLDRDDDAERARRLAAAREVFAQAERKMRMTAVLATGGFPLEALPSLREGVELALRSQATLEGAESTPEDVPADWVRQILPEHFPLVEKLRQGPESLAAGEDQAQAWIAAGERLVRTVGNLIGEGGP